MTEGFGLRLTDTSPSRSPRPGCPLRSAHSPDTLHAAAARKRPPIEEAERPKTRARRSGTAGRSVSRACAASPLTRRMSVSSPAAFVFEVRTRIRSAPAREAVSMSPQTSAAASALRRHAWNRARTRARARGPDRAIASRAVTAIGGRGRCTTDRIEVTEVDREGVIVEGACVEPEVETRESAQVSAAGVGREGVAHQGGSAERRAAPPRSGTARGSPSGCAPWAPARPPRRAR